MHIRYRRERIFLFQNRTVSGTRCVSDFINDRSRNLLFKRPEIRFSSLIPFSVLILFVQPSFLSFIVHFIEVCYSMIMHYYPCVLLLRFFLVFEFSSCYNRFRFPHLRYLPIYNFSSYIHVKEGVLEFYFYEGESFILSCFVNIILYGRIYLT